MTINNCHLCGNPTDAVPAAGHTYWKCTGCGQTFYDNPKPAAEIILVDELGRAAVAVRARDPYKGKLDLPGGFIDSGETLEQGIVREVQEELGLSSDKYSTPVYLASAAADYPWGQEITQVVTATFTAHIDSSVPLTASDDVETIKFLAFDQLSREDFAWPTQYDRIERAIAYWKSQASNP
jgi:ADP-ribose pyrophosphatase YjhB (NUDIX family)